MIKEGLVFKNTKGNPCVILKVDDKYCWVFAKTKQGFNCNHYGRWYIERQLVTESYPVLADYKNWQEAITRYFANKTDELSEIANMELRDQLEAERVKVKKLEEKYNRAIWWLKEIVNNHRFTPISTAEKALEELDR